MVAGGVLTLGRLLDRGRAQSLVDGFRPLAGGGRLALVDPDGRIVAGEAPGTSSDRADAAAVPHVPILLPDGRVIGSVMAAAVPANVVGALAGAVQAVVSEVLDRRMVSLEALERYRELALLYRLAGTIGAALDPRAVIDELLVEAQRALRSDVAVLVPADATRLPAVDAGPPDLVAAARASIAPFLDAVLEGAGSRTVDAADGMSILATPVTGGHGRTAALVLGRVDGAAPFAAPDQRLALALAEHASGALERLHLQAHDAERRRLEQEVSLGRRIQLSLLPQRPPDVEGWSFATHYEPATQVGGDFYDFFRLRDHANAFGIVMADVTGKGIAAALLMAFARPLLRAIADQYVSPATALTQANRVLVLERPTPLFITVFMGVIDAPTGILRYASAGHEPALVVPARGGRVRRLEDSGPLLGAFPVISLIEHTTQLRSGDLLLLHTDGAIDARDPARRRFGDVRLARAAGAARGRTAAELVSGVAGAVSRFAAGAAAADDLALLAVRREAG